jgi:hypothetical protein
MRAIIVIVLVALLVFPLIDVGTRAIAKDSGRKKRGRSVDRAVDSTILGG